MYFPITNLVQGIFPPVVLVPIFVSIVSTFCKKKNFYDGAHFNIVPGQLNLNKKYKSKENNGEEEKYIFMF